ncbi:MAG: helix-turn-helix domain-containing protein [Defluviitaleaceae bacterium]|nr:helix-turn-helix domain-containing protein [Defluviitaleaceae bacterium]
MSTPQNDLMSIGKKIRLLRRHHGMSQVVLAENIGAAQERIIQVEKDKAEYTPKQLANIKILFRIEGLPLSERECAAFKERLLYWSDLIKFGRMDEARAIHKEMANIENLEPCDLDIVMQYKMIEISMFQAEGDLATVEKKLNILENRINEMNADCLYHYHCEKSYSLLLRGCHEDSLEFNFKALNLAEKHERLSKMDKAYIYHRIAACYTYLEIPFKAIFITLKTQLPNESVRITNYHLHSMHLLALNYIRVNEISEARKLLDECLIIADGLKSDEYIGRTMLYYGFMYKKVQEWASAIEYFDEAIRCSQIGTNDCYASYYHKIQCTIQLNTFTKAKVLLEEAKDLCNGNKLWESYFEALGHYLIVSSHMSTNNNESCDYIEKIAIPYFRKMHDHFIALEYCSLLELHYEKSRRNGKSFRITREMTKIYRHVFCQ